MQRSQQRDALRPLRKLFRRQDGFQPVIFSELHGTLAAGVQMCHHTQAAIIERDHKRHTDGIQITRVEITGHAPQPEFFCHFIKHHVGR